MSKKKHPEHVNHERWLVSYADFITLLFAFFVVLFASGQADKKKQQKFASAFNNAFSQMALFSPSSKQPALDDSSGANPNAQPKPIELPLESDGSGEAARQPKGVFQPQATHDRLEQLVRQQTLAGPLHDGDLSLHPTTEGLALSLQEGAFFDSASAVLRPEAARTLQAIAASLPPGPLRVEGHTDNQPIHSALYASNWELSAARASTIAHFLLDHSTLHPAQLSLAGYAEFHPLASNATPTGRAQNRRVDIVFLQPPPAISR